MVLQKQWLLIKASESRGFDGYLGIEIEEIVIRTIFQRKLVKIFLFKRKLGVNKTFFNKLR